MRILVIIMLWSGVLSAQLSEPILRLNTEMHTAKIWRISIDQDEEKILTVSSDKSAKLWDAHTGQLLKTYRVPIEKGNEGMLYAGAISPDGTTIVVGGWTHRSPDFLYTNSQIYFIDTQTEEILQTIDGYGNVILDLEFSPDGNFLAAALGGNKGVNIYKRNSRGLFDLHQELDGYGKSSYNIAWSRNNHFGSVSYDGYLRLYKISNDAAQTFELIKKVKGSGEKPFSLDFHPTKKLLVVGFSDVATLDVFSYPNLEIAYGPDLGGEDKAGAFNKVTFSKDGQQLYGSGFAGRKYSGKRWRIIRQWSEAGQGTYQDYKATDNTLIDVKALNNGDVVYCGTQPDWARMTQNGTQKYYQSAEILDYKVRNLKHLKVGQDGNLIGFDALNSSQLYFDITKRSLGNTQISSLSPYKSEHKGLVLTNWEDSKNPQLNNETLKFLVSGESSRSVDINSSASRLIFGGDWSLYCLDNNGDKIWKTPLQSTAWAVNISDNDKVIIAAQGDGTINWYSMEDGTKLYTLFVLPDEKTWILYTPEGYYDCAPGAEKYIGWHINNGPDKTPYFFPASKFRSKYYRPDVIDNVLVTYDVTAAVELADLSSDKRHNKQDLVQQLPPVVSMISPNDNAVFRQSLVDINYKALSPNGEAITRVKYMIDGRPLETQRGFKPKGTSNVSSAQLELPEKDVTLQVLAENEHGWSTPAEIRLRYRGQPKTKDVLKPTLYVLSIGVSDYNMDDLDLNYAAQDATDFAAALTAQKGGLYKDVVVKKLTDATATKDDILDGLDWIQRQTTSRDMAMIFVAGHGMNDNQGTFFFLPHEADPERLRRTSLMFTELKYTTGAIAGKVIMFVDACHSGNAMGGRRSAPDINALVNELSDVESGAVVFSSSTGKQFSLEDSAWQNGAFTEALIEGLSGKADLFGKGVITIKSLDAYIADRVKQLTKGKQAPTVVIPESMQDFPIGVVR